MCERERNVPLKYNMKRPHGAGCVPIKYIQEDGGPSLKLVKRNVCLESRAPGIVGLVMFSHVLSVGDKVVFGKC